MELSMDKGLPVIYIARHGETAWTITGQHTGLTDLPLTPRDECNARALAELKFRTATEPSGDFACVSDGAGAFGTFST